MCCPWLRKHPPVLAGNEGAPKWQFLEIIELNQSGWGEQTLVQGSAGKAEFDSNSFKSVQELKAWSGLKHGMSC